MVEDEQFPEQDEIERNLANPISWYMRDSGCIESIQGQESDVVSMFAQIEDIWGPGEGANRATAKMLLSCLAASPDTAADNDLKTLRDRAAASKAGWPSKFVPAVIDALLRCRLNSGAGSPQDFNAALRQTITKQDSFYANS